MPVSSPSEVRAAGATTSVIATAPSPQPEKRAKLRAYVMDLWSFIPYYVAHLCSSLGAESIDATLGSTRYHLDRAYFRKTGLAPDSLLLDFGGGIGSRSIRRAVKSFEYVFNLLMLAARFPISRYDILHIEYLPFLEHGLPVEIWLMKWAQSLGTGVVYTVHNATHKNSPDRHKSLYKRAYELADALICHGEQAREELKRDFGIAEEKIWIVPHGPLFAQPRELSQQEARAALGLPTDDVLVLCLGVISEYKGIPFLLDAWKQLQEAGVKGRLLIAGTGDEGLLSSIREKVAADDLGDSVELRLQFIAVEQLPLLHQAADILAYPYKAGTTSGALLTGLNYKKAIVATTLPFFREYLRDGEDSLLVDYGDVDGLAASLRVLLEQPEERLRIGQNVGQKSAPGTSWPEIAHATRQCYDHVAGERLRR